MFCSSQAPVAHGYMSRSIMADAPVKETQVQCGCKRDKSCNTLQQKEPFRKNFK